jgi:hypothetical protein
MDSQLVIIVLVVVAIIAVCAGAWIYAKKMKSRRLRDKFGPEYDQTVARVRNRDVAEAELQARENRVKRFHIVPLSERDCGMYQESWQSVQGHFVDDPKGAVDEANLLICDVMKKRGYPVTDFEQAAADLSVDYPNVVSNYRAASRIADNNRRGVAETEELRQALVYYRALFAELLEEPVSRERVRPVRTGNLADATRPSLRRDGEGVPLRKNNEGGLRNDNAARQKIDD